MEEGTARCDPPVEASSALAGEDLKYWAAHPELPALVSHFMAKVLEVRPNEARIFARDLFCREDLEDQVNKAMSRNGGVFNEEQRKATPVKLNRGERSKKEEKKKKTSNSGGQEERCC